MSVVPDERSWATPGSSERNKQEICNNLAQVMADSATVLEVASGFGVHLQLLASTYKHVQFTPSEAQQICLDRLGQISAEHANVRRPIHLNMMMCVPEDLKGHQFDGLLAVNLIHISPFQVTENLFSLGKELRVDWVACYGAFKINGQFTSVEDEKFNDSLRSRDSRWGLRDLGVVSDIAGKYGFGQREAKPTKANNWFVIWRKV